jgi:hypothetical protein
MTSEGVRNKAIAETCKEVWVAIGLGGDGQRGPRTWAELVPCLEQYRNRVTEAEADAEELHRKLMEFQDGNLQDKIIKEFREADMVYLQTLGLAKAVAELLGTQCSTEVGFRAWYYETYQEAKALRQEVIDVLGAQESTATGFHEWFYKVKESESRCRSEENRTISRVNARTAKILAEVIATILREEE